MVTLYALIPPDQANYRVVNLVLFYLAPGRPLQ